MTYIRYALFDSLRAAQETLGDIYAERRWNKPPLLILHDGKLGEAGALRLLESDGRRGLMLGLLSGMLMGCVFGLLLTSLGVLQLPLLSGALFGLFCGALFGGLGGGLYGSGLATRALQQVEKFHERGMVLLTIEVSGTLSMLRVMNIVRRHHTVATG